MNPIRGHNSGDRSGALPRAPRLPALLLAAAMLLLMVPPAARAQSRLLAAQTGPNEVTLSWDSVPGTSQYLLYAAPADSVVGNLRVRPPLQRLSGSSHTATLFGVRRLAGDITLVAMAANGHVIQKAEFNRITPATSFSPIQPPEEVTAEVTGPTEITLTWTPVPGATAYYIGRAVAPGGLSTLCMVCSAEPRYVDQDALPGAAHSYSVAAIFPNGKSQAAPSNPVTPGVTPTGAAIQVASTSAATATYTKTQPATTGSSTPTSTPTTTTSTSSSSTAATPTATSGTAGTTYTTATGSPISAATDAVHDIISSAVGGVTGAVSAPSYVNAILAGAGSVRVTWSPSSTAGVTEYRISRSVNGGTWQLLNTVAAGSSPYTDAFFPVTLFAAGPVRVSYGVVAVQSGVYSSSTTSAAVTVQPPASGLSTTNAPALVCKLDYQRADNMWAAFGRPDGPLGTETISLAGGQDKVFITDWKYEKTRNDGSNYYGSHLRIATNNSTHTIRLQLRSLTLTGLVVYARTGQDTFWIRLDPGKAQLFQADLMEVFCEN